MGSCGGNDGFGSVFDLGTIPEHLATDHYRAILESSPAGIFELMVHPAREADELEGLTQIGRVSENEWRFLCSDCLPALISELGFTLGSYRSALKCLTIRKLADISMTSRS